MVDADDNLKNQNAVDGDVSLRTRRSYQAHAGATGAARWLNFRLHEVPVQCIGSKICSKGRAIPSTQVFILQTSESAVVLLIIR